MQAIINYCIKEKKKRVTDISAHLNITTYAAYLDLSEVKKDFVMIAKRDHKLYPKFENLIKEHKSFDKICQIVLIYKKRLFCVSDIDLKMKKIDPGLKLAINKVIDYGESNVVLECCICLENAKDDGTTNRTCGTCGCLICNECYASYVKNIKNELRRDEFKITIRCPTCRELFCTIRWYEL